MKRLTVRLAVGLIAFAVGLAAAELWRSPQLLPYCEVARNGQRYHNRIIRVRATLSLGPDAIYIYEDCDPVEALMSRVDLNRGSESDTRAYVEQLLVNGRNSSRRKVEAIIEGRFNAEFTNGCWGPKYHMAARKVELLTPISDYAPSVCWRGVAH